MPPKLSATESFSPWLHCVIFFSTFSAPIKNTFIFCKVSSAWACTKACTQMKSKASSLFSSTGNLPSILFLYSIERGTRRDVSSQQFKAYAFSAQVKREAKISKTWIKTKKTTSRNSIQNLGIEYSH